MARFRRKNKSGTRRRKLGKWGRRLVTIGCIALCLFCLGAVVSFAKDDSQPAGAIFKVGGLDETTGKYVENDKTIYTEKAIDCYGLRIEPDFESTVTYDIYYYDGEDKLLKVVKGLSDVYDEDFEVAEKCRIVIHPEIPEDVKEKDFKVRLWNVAKYSSMLKISNAKESNGINYENLYNEDTIINGSSLILNYEENGEPKMLNIFKDIDTSEASSICSITPAIEIDKNVDGVVLFVNITYPPESYAFLYLADENGDTISAISIHASSTGIGEGWHMVKLSESDVKDAVYVMVSFNTTAVNDMYVYTFND